MEKKYYAVTRKGSDDLQHWKYIKKKKVNGKWKYYYKNKDGEKYDKAVSYTKHYTGKDGKNITQITRYRDHLGLKNKKMVDRQEVFGRGTFEDVLYKRGSIDRNIAKAEKWIYNTFLKDNSVFKKTIKKLKKKIDNGKKWLASRGKKQSSPRKTYQTSPDKYEVIVEPSKKPYNDKDSEVIIAPPLPPRKIQTDLGKKKVNIDVKYKEKTNSQPKRKNKINRPISKPLPKRKIYYA